MKLQYSEQFQRSIYEREPAAEIVNILSNLPFAETKPFCKIEEQYSHSEKMFMAKTKKKKEKRKGVRIMLIYLFSYSDE